MTAEHTPFSTPAAQRAQLKAFAKDLQSLLVGVKNPTGFKLAGPNGLSLTVPQVLMPVLARAAEILAGGDSLSLVPIEEDVTTQTAAEMLNISRQYLVRLLESGEIPYHKTGAHRRLHIQDVLTYRKKRG